MEKIDGVSVWSVAVDGMYIGDMTFRGDTAEACAVEYHGEDEVSGMIEIVGHGQYACLKF